MHVKMHSSVLDVMLVTVETYLLWYCENEEEHAVPGISKE